MNSIQKVLLTAGLFLQLTSAIHASGPNITNYANAFMAMTNLTDPIAAANAIFNARGTLPSSGTTGTIALANKASNSPEALATALSLTLNGNSPAIAKKFQGADSAANFQTALNTILNGSSMPTMSGPTPSNPVTTPVTNAPASTPVTVPTPTASTSTAASQALADANAQIATLQAAQKTANAQIATLQAQLQANIQAAMQTQQQQDAAVAAQQQQALTAIVNSGATGASLYNAYIDLVFSSLGQAIGAIADASVQQQVISYIQNKVAGIKAAASVTSKNSHALGRMDSSKSHKHKKHNKKTTKATKANASK